MAKIVGNIISFSGIEANASVLSDTGKGWCSKISLVPEKGDIIIYESDGNETYHDPVVDAIYIPEGYTIDSISINLSKYGLISFYNTFSKSDPGATCLYTYSAFSDSDKIEFSDMDYIFDMEYCYVEDRMTNAIDGISFDWDKYKSIKSQIKSVNFVEGYIKYRGFPYTRVKIGDGFTAVGDLPFIDETVCLPVSRVTYDNQALSDILAAYILEIDYSALAFDTTEIVVNSNTTTTAILGQAILGQMRLA